MNTSPPPFLIVEDNRLTQYALEWLISRRGWHVLTASSVAEGIDLLGTHPACIILDLMLPDGGGEAVLRAVRTAGLDSRVIVCTGVMDEGVLDGLKTLTPDAVIHKPIVMSELLEACSA